MLVDKHKLKKQDKETVINIINNLIKDPDSFYFRHFVDYKKLNLEDYRIIIKKPMDLNTLLNNVMKNQYKYIEDVFDDLQLIWDNCALYNSEDSELTKLSLILGTKVKKLIKYYFKMKFIYGKNNSSYKLLELQKLDGYLKK